MGGDGRYLPTKPAHRGYVEKTMNKSLLASTLVLVAMTACTERYEVIESRHWVNSRTGATASIYGAVPWTRHADAGHWRVVSVGWTIRDLRTGTVGCGRPPFPTAAMARAWITQKNNRKENAHAQASHAV